MEGGLPKQQTLGRNLGAGAGGSERRHIYAQDSRALTLRILQAIWNAKNPSLIDELYSNDCVIHTPDGEVHGVEGSKHLYHTYTSAFPDMQFEIQQIVAEDDRHPHSWYSPVRTKDRWVRFRRRAIS